MYRIELSPGEETVFRSIEELAVAIKRGVVTPRARIHHNASGKWLPIQFHPHYKTALSTPLTQSALVAGPPVRPLSSLSLAPTPEPEPVAMTPPAAPAPRASEPARKKKPAKEKSGSQKRSGRRSHRQLRIALVGTLLLGGAQWVLSEPLFSRGEVPALYGTHRRLMPAPANTAAMLPTIRTPHRPSTALFGGRSSVLDDSTSEIEPAPDSIELAVGAAPRVDSLNPPSADSSSRKAIKGILRAVGGTSGKESASANR